MFLLTFDNLYSSEFWSHSNIISRNFLSIEKTYIERGEYHVKISSYKYPYALLSYSNQDQDLKNKSWTKDASAINFSAQEMSNQMLVAEVINGSIYYISRNGRAWDLNPKTKLFHWDNKPIEMDSTENFEVKFLTSIGAYYSSNESGLLRVLGTPKNLNLPKDLLAEDEFCQIQTKVEEIFSYRFSTSYGDYSCMGGSLLKSQLTNQNAEVTPQFSTYAWITKENLLHLRWQKTFAEFDVDSGIIIDLGMNMGLWWNGIK